MPAVPRSTDAGTAAGAALAPVRPFRRVLVGPVTTVALGAAETVGPVTTVALGAAESIAPVTTVALGAAESIALGAAESIGVGIAEALWLDPTVDVGLVDPLGLAPLLAQPAAAMPMSSTTAASLIGTIALRFTG